MTNAVFAMFLALSLLTACGSEESSVQTLRVKPNSDELSHIADSLPRVAETYRQVVVIPWLAITSEKYLRFKTHAYLEDEKALVVSTIVPDENWFYSPPAGIVQVKQKYLLDESISTKQMDVYVRAQDKTTSVTKKIKNSRRNSTSHIYPYRFEIKLYKSVNGEYTGECDYSVVFQERATWSGLNEIRDGAIHQSCPLHKVMKYSE